MPDLASLSFDIDSSQAQRAISVLETLKATSVSLTQSANQQGQATTALSQIYDRQRDQISRLADVSRGYDGTLQGLIVRLNQTRQAMNDSQTSLNGYAETLTKASSAAITFNGAIDGLDRYIAKARELRTTTADLATGFERITAALRNQTIEGVQTRTMLTQLGVSLGGVSQDRSDVVLQRVADQLRQYRATGQTLAAAQQILGPSFDQRALTALQNQPYVPYAQQVSRERASGASAQIDSQQQQILRITAELARNEARRQDLADRYTLNPTVAGRVGLTGVGYGLSANQQRQRLEEIDRLPENERRQYEGYGFRISQAINNSGPANMVRNFTSGTYGSNEDEIRVRQQMDAAASSWGMLGAVFNRMGRDVENVFGTYKPILTQDTRNLSPFEQRYLRQQSGGILQNLGDPALANINSLDTQLSEFTAPETLQRYRASFGTDGQRRYTNQLASIQQNRMYARAPEQQGLDASAREQLILSLPEAQRAQARFAMQFLGEQAGTAATALPIGTPLRGITDNVNLTPAQRTAGNQIFGTRVAGQLQEQTEQADNQIDFQKRLAESLEGGRGAAENFTRSYSTYRQTLLQGATEEQAIDQGMKALNVTMAQRVTQSRSLIQQQREENQISEQRLNQARQLVTADPLVRRTAEISLGIETERQRMVAGGQLVDPGGGEFMGRRYTAPEAAELNRQFVQGRTQESQISGLTGAATLESTQRTNVADAQHVADIMERQGVSLENATRQLEAEKQFHEQIAKLSGDASDAAHREVEARQRTTIELQRQIDLEHQRAANLQAATGANQQAQINQVLQGLPPDQRELVRQLAPNLIQTLNAGQVSLTGTTGDRAQSLIERYQRDLGVTREGAAAMAAHAVGESGVRPIDEVNPTVPGSRGGIGYFQYTGEGRGRRGQFEAFAKARGLDPHSDEASILFSEHDLKTQYPQILDTMRTPGRSAAQQSEAFQPYVFGTDPRLNRLGPERAAIAQGLARGGARPATAGGTANLEQVIREALLTGKDPNIAGLPPDVAASVTSMVTAFRTNIRSGQTLRDTTEGESTGARLDQLREQAGLAGQPGLQSRVQTRDPTLPADLAERQARRGAQGVAAGQRVQQLNTEAGTAQQIGDITRTTQANEQSAAAVALLTARLRAEQEQRAVGADNINTDLRARQLLTEEINKQGTSIAQTTRTARDQIEDQRRLTGAIGHGTEAYRNAQIENAAAAERRLLVGLRQMTTDKDQIALIDQQIDRLNRQTAAQRELGLEQAKTQAAGESKRLGDQSRLEEADLAQGPFASPSQLRRARSEAQLAQRFANEPGLAGTPEGQGLVDANRHEQDIQDQAERMNELRQAAHGAQGAIENAMDALIVRGEKGRDVAKSLAETMEQIILRTVVYKPFEKLMDSALSSLFGGEASGGGGGGGAGGGTGGGGLGKGLFNHAGGLTGSAVDAVGGDGFYKGGGLIGSWFGGKGGGGGGGDSGFVDSGSWDSAEIPSARGNVFSTSRARSTIADFESQVVEAPTYFRFAKGGAMGLMGEAGAEAVMPLKRGPDGKLGISSAGHSSGPAIVFNISTPDADSFRASQAQLHSRAMAQMSRTQGRNS